MLNKKIRDTSKKKFKTLRNLDVSLFFNLSYSGFFKFKRKTYILITYSFIYLNFILKSYYYYLAVKKLTINDEFKVPIIFVIIN